MHPIPTTIIGGPIRKWVIWRYNWKCALLGLSGLPEGFCSFVVACEGWLILLLITDKLQNQVHSRPREWKEQDCSVELAGKWLNCWRFSTYKCRFIKRCAKLPQHLSSIERKSPLLKGCDARTELAFYRIRMVLLSDFRPFSDCWFQAGLWQKQSRARQEILMEGRGGKKKKEKISVCDEIEMEALR